MEEAAGAGAEEKAEAKAVDVMAATVHQRMAAFPDNFLSIRPLSTSLFQVASSELTSLTLLVTRMLPHIYVHFSKSFFTSWRKIDSSSVSISSDS